jgi:two-component system, NtrC family, response regulator GlrR
MLAEVLDDLGEVPASTAGDKTVRITHEPERGRALCAPLELRVISGPDQGTLFRARGDRLVIGVHPRADLVLTDGTVSRFHCEIAIEAERVAVRDLGSKNGTQLDGVSMEKAYARIGSRLRLGQSEVEILLGREPVSIELLTDRQFGAMVGDSVPMRQAFALLKKAAESDATLLISGETGTGKELAAEAVHASSSRSAGPFVIVDCGAIPANLIESELFGHEKGAFTGATSAREGAFEAARGGTIFLDEIGELELELQPKLLRVLERKHVKRVGGNQHLPVDARVIAATNRSLQAEVNERRFRADLFYRLAVVEVRIPALRERPEDIPLLVERILESMGALEKSEARVLESESARRALMQNPWPGNVRELRNYVERTLALADPGPLLSEVGEQRPKSADLKSARQSFVRDFERRYLEQLLAEHAGNVSAAARTADVDRRYLYRLLWRHGLR